MRRPEHSIVTLLAVASCLSGSFAIASDPTHDEATTPLSAVSKRETYVFASTPDGLFRAPLETKRWERLKTPPQMPMDGTFAVHPGRSPLLIYVAMRKGSRPIHAPPPDPSLRYGLYLTRDDGLTWELISERKDYGSTLLLPDGNLFAVTGADGANHGLHVLRSSDMGKTWSDITGREGAQITKLDLDPDHPGLIRIRGWNHRGECTFTADDANYRWEN